MAESSCRPRKVDGDGAAKRRRQRRLRSWLRHEQQTVAAVLATVSHHSFQKVDTALDGLRALRTVTSTREGVEHEKHVGLRAQKPPLPGERPGCLVDPGPQRSDRTVRHSAGEAPLLVVASLAGGDEVDATTVLFPPAREPEAADVPRRRRRRGSGVSGGRCLRRSLWRSWMPSRASLLSERAGRGSSWRPWKAHDACKPSSGSSRRKRKKRKKRRLPRVPRHGGRRPPWSCSLCSSSSPSFWCLSFSSLSECWTFSVMPQRRIRCAVFGLIVTRPLLRNDRCHGFPAVACARLILLVFCGRDVLPSIFGRPRCLASWPVWFPSTLCI